MRTRLRVEEVCPRESCGNLQNHSAKQRAGSFLSTDIRGRDIAMIYRRRVEMNNEGSS